MITSLIYLVIWLIVIGCLCVVLLLLQFMGAVGPMPRLAP